VVGEIVSANYALSIVIGFGGLFSMRCIKIFSYG
jgi:hypothetical protein